jgi:hypothetical protein
MDSPPLSFTLISHPKKAQIRVSLLPEGILPEGQPILEYRLVREVSLLHAMASEYDVGHYLCRIWTQDKRKLFIRANDGDLAQCSSFQDFVLTFHPAAQAANPSIRFSTGMRSKWAFGLLNGIFGMLFAVLIAAVIFLMVTDGKILEGILIILGILIMGAFLFLMIYALAKPGTYDPRQIPARLLPLD